jgi:hypothetical protein
LVAGHQLDSGARRGSTPIDGRKWVTEEPGPYSLEDWNALGRSSWLGREIAAGVLPHHRDLLRDWTFVGLPAEEVSRVLHAPVDIDRMNPGQYLYGYHSVSFRICCPEQQSPFEYQVLELRFSMHSRVVMSERMYTRGYYPQY